MTTKYSDLSAFSDNWPRFLVWGVLLVILGMIAITAATFTTLVSIVLLGVLILVSGIVMIIDTFTFWWGKWSGFFLHVLAGILCFIVGAMLIKSPILASVPITLFLGIFYFALGIFRIMYALSLKIPKWGWSFFSGIISLLLGALIIASWPASSLYIIGLFIGIDLIFAGWAYIMLSLSGKTLAKAK